MRKMLIFVLLAMCFFVGCTETQEKDIDRLIEELKDEDAGVREKAALALGKMGDKKAVEPLVEALRDENSDVRWAAVASLGHMKDARAVVPLTKALKDENDMVRFWAAGILADMGDERAVKPLIEALRHEDDALVGVAKQALRMLTKQDFGEDYDKWQEWYEKSRDK